MTLLTSTGATTARRPAPAPVTSDPQPLTSGPAVPGRHRGPGRLVSWWRGIVRRARRSADSGMATAEYAIVTVAAAAFAGLLIAVLRSDEVRGLLVGIIRGALSV